MKNNEEDIKYRVRAKLGSSFTTDTPYLKFVIQKKFLDLIWITISSEFDTKSTADNYCETLNQTNK